MKKKIKQDMNLIKLASTFHSEDKCREYLELLRWNGKVTCPRCGCASVSKVIERNQYDCNSCRYQFSVTSGTIFHDSHLPLWKWFLATYIMTESKKGISANQIKRTLDTTYRTAWYLCHRIRNTMTVQMPELLNGIVEVDETFVGGTTEGMGHGYKGNKTIAMDALERDGEVRLQKVDDRKRATLHKFIKNHIAPDTEAIYTDEFPAYKGIADHNTKHECVNHSQDEWVRGDVTTNSIENIFSLFKRSVMGSYHKVSKKHLDAYLDELEWRFNNRENPFLFRDTLKKLLNSDNLRYDQLVSD